MMSLFEIRRISHVLLSLLTLASVTLLQGCFWESDDDPAPSYAIGGTVSGLSGTLVLQNNSGDDLTLTADGSFAFATSITSGGDYAVSVLSQPSNQACAVTNSSGSASATVDNVIVECADPVGYYSQGDLDVNGGATTDNGSFQALIHDNRLFLLSVSTGLLYEGDITITGDSFTTTATIYEDGVNTGTTEISGTITPSSEIAGDLTGSGVGSGTFSVLYATSNSETADVTNITKTWASHVGGSTDPELFENTIASNGAMNYNNTTSDGNFDLCRLINGTITRIDGTNLFTVSAPLSSCTGSGENIGDYTGLATSEDPYTTLVFIMTKSDYGLSGDFQ